MIVGQLKSSWATSIQMIDAIRTGELNKYLIRPISFFTYHLMMFIGINSLYIIVYISLLILFVLIYPGMLFTSLMSILGFAKLEDLIGDKLRGNTSILYWRENRSVEVRLDRKTLLMTKKNLSYKEASIMYFDLNKIKLLKSIHTKELKLLNKNKIQKKYFSKIPKFFNDIVDLAKNA